MSESSPGMVSQSISSLHLTSAEHFAERTGELEQGYIEEYQSSASDSTISDEQLHYGQLCRAFALYSCISSAAYLESHINEVYKHHVQIFEEEYPMSRESQRITDDDFVEFLQRYHTVEEGDFYYKPTIQKFQAFLKLAGRETLDRGASPCQDVKSIIDTRNYFTHYKTEFNIPYRDLEHLEHRIGSSLQGKFETSPIANEGMPYFPNHCLSHGFAGWCVGKSKEFVERFYELAEIEPQPVPATKHISRDND